MKPFPNPATSAGKPGGDRGAFRGEQAAACRAARAHTNWLFVYFSNGAGRDHDEVRTGSAPLL
ncbi:hypothetical protein AB6846_05840 [Serratia proteamaculans]